MSPALTRLMAATTANTEVDQSAITLINGLAEQIRENVSDQTALLALADELDASSESLSTAVTANTPAGEPSDPEQPNPQARQPRRG